LSPRDKVKPRPSRPLHSSFWIMPAGIRLKLMKFNFEVFLMTCTVPTMAVFLIIIIIIIIILILILCGSVRITLFSLYIYIYLFRARHHPILSRQWNTSVPNCRNTHIPIGRKTISITRWRNEACGSFFLKSQLQVQISGLVALTFQ
jgi:hypothetical protein